jgi:RNA polymerase sigma-54 factor
MRQLQQTSLSQEQRLSQRMSPQLIQSVKLMELPVADLRDRIEEELERNPALEVLEDKALVSLDTMYKRRRGEAVSDGWRQFIEGALTRGETLQEHLLWQLRLQVTDGRTREAGERLIQNIDDDGFNLEPPESLFTGADGIGAAALEKALDVVRRLEPAGCCTSGYGEALAVQAGIAYGSGVAEGIRRIIPCLAEIERGKLQAAALKTGFGERKIAALFEKIKALSPFPGRQWAEAGADRTRFVVPDVQVVRRDGEFSIILNDEEIPVLGIQPFFLKQTETKAGLRGAARDFARENVKEARWFIQSINRRNHTLLRVTRAILEFQRGFFTDGPKYLSPLTLRDVACELDVHETTVSRAANGKYMQTDWGIFEIRHFFCNSISGKGSMGSRYSREGVKEMIREMLKDEGSRQQGRRLSDMDIARQLEKRGIKLSRRTVSKYRNQLDLESSYRR